MPEEATGWGGGLWAAADLATPMAIRVAATLRLADHIAAGARTAGALAAATGAHRETLERLLAHLVTAGVLDRGDAGTYRLTELGEHLRDDDPDGVRPWLDLTGAVGRADLCFTELLHTVRTGEPAFPRRFGRPYWEDLSADPVLAATFDDLMGGRLAADAPAIATAYPWENLGHLVDVGGGDATLLITILRAHPGLRGTNVELPGPTERAARAIAAAGLADRASAVAGSFFDPLPAGAGGYLLSGVVHNWPDADATRILRNCAEAAGASGTVIVIEDSLSSTPDTAGDLRMLCYCGGRDRSADQLAALAGAAGLRLTSLIPAGSRSLAVLRANQPPGAA